jgi:hypothetical protein
MELRTRLTELDGHHSHFVDAMAYAVAGEFARLQNEYVLMHLKPRPWWMPAALYRWIVSKIVYLRLFKEPASFHYCCNGSTNCKYTAHLMNDDKLTTP